MSLNGRPKGEFRSAQHEERHASEPPGPAVKRTANTPRWLAALALALAFGPVAAPAATPPGDTPLADPAGQRADLASAFALLGLPCGTVLKATRLAENDHLVQCSDGHRWRVRIDRRGRVVAAKP